MPRLRFSTAPAKRRPPGRGELLRWSLLLLIAAIMLDQLLLYGLWTPVVVSSGSMAPALLGPHVNLTCAHCNTTFAIDADGLPPSGAALCPNCGARQPLGDARRQRGDRVLVNRAAYAWRAPRRWERTVFRLPDQPQSMAVKRIVGLPGETIELRAGDVYINGQLVQKTLDEFRQLAVEVYNSQHGITDADGTPIGWNHNRLWQFHAGHLTFESSAATGGDRGLEFRGNQISETIASTIPPSPALGLDEGHFLPRQPLTDDLGYNQNVQQPLFEVSDWLLEGRLNVFGEGTLQVIMLGNRGRNFHLQIEPNESRWKLFGEQFGRPLAEGMLPRKASDESWRFCLAMIGGQVCVQFGEQQLFHYDFKPGPAEYAHAPIVFAPDRVSVDLSQIRIARDLYYRNSAMSANLKTGQTLTLGKNQYIVLGDNSAISDDSRSWLSSPFVTRTQLLGRPILLQRQ